MKPSVILVVPVVAGLLLLAGCPPCKQLCIAQADAYALCLGEWGMTWEDVGYAGIEDYQEVCKEAAELERKRQGSDADKIAFDRDCAEDNRLLRGTDDCEQLYEDLAALTPDS